MPAFSIHRSSVNSVQPVEGEQSTSHGGQILLDAIARRFGLWDRLASLPAIDPRRRASQGFSPQAIVAQILFSFTSGGVCLADAERLGLDKALLELLGLDRSADQSTLGQWLRAQSKEGLEALHRLNAELIDWIIAEAKRLGRGNWIWDGKPKIFFDDTQIEVYGRCFEGATKNYEGNLALGWQTLWLGPFLLDGVLGQCTEVSAQLPLLLDEHRHRWEGLGAHFFADSASSDGRWLNPIAKAGFGSWSVSYNKWTDKLDRLAAELPSERWWRMPAEPGRQPDALDAVEEYGWLSHLPGDNEEARTFAVRRRKGEGEMLWRHCFIVCDPGDAALSSQPQAARDVFERHALKGASEQGFSQLLSDFDLHHPPCQSLAANEAWYVLGMMAYNLLQALRLLHMPADAQGWRVRSIIRHLLTVPVVLKRHARYVVARVCVPAGWLRWWRLFVPELEEQRRKSPAGRKRHAAPAGRKRRAAPAGK